MCLDQVIDQALSFETLGILLASADNLFGDSTQFDSYNLSNASTEVEKIEEFIFCLETFKRSYNCFLRKYQKYDLPMAEYGKIDFVNILKNWELKVNVKNKKYFNELKNILTTEKPKKLTFNFIDDLEKYENKRNYGYSKANPQVLNDRGTDINYYVDNMKLKVEKNIQKNKSYIPLLKHNIPMKKNSRKQKIRNYNNNESILNYEGMNNNNLGNQNNIYENKANPGLNRNSKNSQNIQGFPQNQINNSPENIYGQKFNQIQQNLAPPNFTGNHNKIYENKINSGLNKINTNFQNIQGFPQNQINNNSQAIIYEQRFNQIPQNLIPQNFTGNQSDKNNYQKFNDQEAVNQRAIGSFQEPIDQRAIGSFQGPIGQSGIGPFQEPIDQRTIGSFPKGALNPYVQLSSNGA